MKKKVLMITNRFIYGGIEKLLLDVFEHKSCSDIQYDLLSLISEKDDELIRRIEDAGVGYYSLELDKHNTFERQIYHYKKLYNFITNNHYDVVHINITSYARVLDMLVVKMSGVKTRIIHSHSANEKDTISRKIIRPIRKLYDYTATDFLACSDGAAKQLFSRKICKEKKYIVINNGIEIDNYLFSHEERIKVRDSLGIQDGDMLIGHVGRFTEAKNHLFILSVFNELHKLKPSSKLLLVGDGEKREEIEKEIIKLNIKDRVILFGSSSDIRALLSAMDVFLFPSVWEGLGISVIEAQCNGLPCYISEKVPKTAIILSNVHQYDITAGPKWWAKCILNENNDRVNEIDRIRKSGYNIADSVHQLEKLYLKNS